MNIKPLFQPGEVIPRRPGATFIGRACCRYVRLAAVTAADGEPAIEAYCAACLHPSLLLRDGKVIGTSA